MKKSMKKGFTLIEIALFLAVTGMLFVGIVAGVQNSMFQQRYNDAVQSFAEFLRMTYSQTLNVENPRENGGRNKSLAIYGKLVTFGESKSFIGDDNSDGAIFSYTVVGEIKDDSDDDSISNDALTEFRDRDLRVMLDDADGFRFVGLAEQYFPRWESRIETTRGWEDNGYEEFVGALLVVRHPRSGAVYTYALKGGTVDINALLGQENLTVSLKEFFPEGEDSVDGFQLIENDGIDFCVDPNGGRQGARRDVRIVNGAFNASGIEIIGQDGSENRCEP